MPIFLFIFAAMFLGDLLWWRWADLCLRVVPRRRLWRTLLAIFCSVQILYLAWFGMFPVQARRAHSWMPIPPLAMVYLWHLLILPATLLSILFGKLIRLMSRLACQKKASSDPSPDAGITRRQALAAAAVAVPPLLMTGTLAQALREVGHFRIRRMDLSLADLPAEFDGLTIAHVSDIHVGRFTRPAALPKIADAVNSLRADIVAMTGDLIDLTLADLPAGIDFIRRLDPRQGLFMIEGNHDLIESRLEFERRVRDASLPLLLDESATIDVRGRALQFLGLTWGRGESAIVSSMANLIRQRRPDAFQILLAHHPHAFDVAAAVGIPLTLAGHTHGGQLMLNERLGAGPVMFRYWSGLYRKNASALVVSNGIGNWFPLRINAPAEIIHLTLRHVR